MESLTPILKSLLIDTTLIVSSLVGVIIVYGLLFGLQENISRKNLIGSLGYFGVIITAPGVIIHELSHYIGCKIFRYRVNEVKLFRPIEGKKDGCLGYVSHSHNKDNVIQNIGMFFVGAAPVIGGASTLLILIRFLLPEVFTVLLNKANVLISSEGIQLSTILNTQIDMVVDTIKTLFTTTNMQSIQFWIFLYLAICISAHIGLSTADLKGSFSGLISLFIATFIITIVLFIFNISTSTIINTLSIYNLVLIAILSMALCLSLIHLSISYIIKMLFSIIR